MHSTVHCCLGGKGDDAQEIPAILSGVQGSVEQTIHGIVNKIEDLALANNAVTYGDLYNATCSSLSPMCWGPATCLI